MLTIVSDVHVSTRESFFKKCDENEEKSTDTLKAKTFNDFNSAKLFIKIPSRQAQIQSDD